MRAVQYDEFGGIDVLRVAEVPEPVPGPDEVLVKVAAAGINPGEAYVREGRYAERWPSTFPSGQGSDLAGTVSALGPGVNSVTVGDEVFGWTDARASQAEYVAVPLGQIVAKPSELAWEQAGALHVVGATAWAAVRAVDPQPGETVVVSAAAGGVGVLTVQLARRTGATVVGIASEANHEWLRAHGVVPVAHGDGLVDGIRAVAPTVDAFIDLFGDGYVDAALALGVPADRIDTIIDFTAVEKHGVKADGNAVGARPDVLAELAALLAKGELELPVAATYPLERVQDAYRELERRHTRGKIVLRPRTVVRRAHGPGTIGSMAGRVEAVAVAVVRTDAWARVKSGRSGIDKRPVDGPVLLTASGVDGDTICDVAHHGGPDQAVYAYSTDDLAWWSTELGRPVATVGQNLTLSGVDCSGAVIGERWQVGEAVLAVRGPRIPCRVFAGFLDVPDLVKRFLAARRPGCYLAVESAGEVRAGDPVTVLSRPAHGVTVLDLMDAMTGERTVLPRVRRAEPDLGVRGREWLARVG